MPKEELMRSGMRNATGLLPPQGNINCDYLGHFNWDDAWTMIGKLAIRPGRNVRLVRVTDKYDLLAGVCRGDGILMPAMVEEFKRKHERKYKGFHHFCLFHHEARFPFGNTNQTLPWAATLICLRENETYEEVAPYVTL
jgi:hypothetical protein